MKLLLDSHILLWVLDGSPQTPQLAKKLVLDASNDVFYSSASIWELSIKHVLHPERMPYPAHTIRDLCIRAGFKELPVTSEHVETVETLIRPDSAPRHKDPFDRMLLAQAKYEGMRLVSHDSLLPHYGEPCLLAV